MSEILRVMPSSFAGFSREDAERELARIEAERLRQEAEAEAERKRQEAKRSEAERKKLEELARGNAGQGNITAPAPDDILAGSEIVTVTGAFDKCMDQLLDANARIIFSEELAAARVSDAAAKGDWKKSELCTMGCYVGENFNYLPNGDIIVAKTRYNPILQNPKVATDCHRNGKEFCLSALVLEQLQDLAEKDLDDAIKSGVLLLERKEIIPIYTSKPFTNKLGIFLFYKQLQPYCSFCKDAEIDQITVSITDAKERAFARALWVLGLGLGSGLLGYDLGGYGGGLHLIDGRVRGVRSAQSEGGAQ
jgi:hypothetical protein